MITETTVQVADRPTVELFLAQAGPTPTGGADTELPLLVIHGGPDWDHSYLREPLTQLADRRQVLLPDLRGCGRSTRGLPDDQYTPQAATGDLLALLDALAIREADILGFSYRGLLAQRLALTAPDRVRRLIVASSSVLPVPSKPAGDARQPFAAGTETGAALTQAMAVAQAEDNVWRPEALPEYLARLDRVRFSAEWARPWLAGTLPSPRLPNAATRLAALEKPLLLLHGSQDTVFPADLAQEAARLIPTAQPVVLSEAGHMAHIDQPHAWLTAVARFVSS